MTPESVRRRRLALAWRESGLTYSEIGRGLGVSKERARQLAVQGAGLRRMALYRIARDIDFLVRVDMWRLA